CARPSRARGKGEEEEEGRRSTRPLASELVVLDLPALCLDPAPEQRRRADDADRLRRQVAEEAAAEPIVDAVTQPGSSLRQLLEPGLDRGRDQAAQSDASVFELVHFLRNDGDTC